MTETINLAAPRDLVEILTKRGANIEKIVQDALSREANQPTREELRRLILEAGEILQKVPEEAIVKAIRKSRDEH